MIFRSCEFKSHQPHHSFFLLDSLNSILYAVVAELADALSSGGSGVIRESSNLSDRTTKMRKSSSIGWAFLLRLLEWSVGLFSLAACLAPPCGRYFCIGILSKEEIFFIRCEAKNVSPLTMGSLSARRDYDIIYTTMSAPFTRRRMTHWGSVPRCHSCDAPSFKAYNPLNLLPIGMGLWR